MKEDVTNTNEGKYHGYNLWYLKPESPDSYIEMITTHQNDICFKFNDMCPEPFIEFAI